MGSLITIALIVLFISFMTFVTFFGRLPFLRHTPIVWLHRLLWVNIPGAFLWVDKKLTGGRVSSSMSRFGRCMLYDRHPTVVIFFILLLLGGEYIYLPGVWPHLTTFQKISFVIAVLGPYVFLYLSAASDPGYITPANHMEQMAQYPYDFAMFHPGSQCRTCQLLKPARSKHCGLCKHCIARADHHCIFINNCVGAGNLHWFILLLLSTALLLTYSTHVGIRVLCNIIQSRWPEFRVWPLAMNDLTWSKWFSMWSYGLQADVGVGGLTFLTLMTSPLVWGLYCYNVYMIWAGTTTNESLKWADWRSDIADGLAYRRRMSPARQKDLRFEPAWTRWPIEAEQIMIANDNGVPRADSNNIPGVGDWIQVRALREVKNLYDLGFWDNFMEVFWPRS